jgi:hypothetical protein
LLQCPAQYCLALSIVRASQHMEVGQPLLSHLFHLADFRLIISFGDLHCAACHRIPQPQRRVTPAIQSQHPDRNPPPPHPPSSPFPPASQAAVRYRFRLGAAACPRPSPRAQPG